MRFYGTVFDTASKTMVWKSALIRVRKSFTNIKKGRGSDTDHFQTIEPTQTAMKYE